MCHIFGLPSYTNRGKPGEGCYYKELKGTDYN
jgi:hypothetical protein